MKFTIDIQPPYDHGCLSVTAFTVDQEDEHNLKLRSRIYCADLTKVDSLQIPGETEKPVENANEENKETHDESEETHEPNE